MLEGSARGARAPISRHGTSQALGSLLVAPRPMLRPQPSRIATRSMPVLIPHTVQEEQAVDEALSEEYSRRMKDAMGWGDRPYDYHYSRGLYYHEILPGVFCGSQPRHSHDIEELKRELGVNVILSLQQDKDMQHWGVSPDEIKRSCQQLGLQLHRRPVQDFDPHSLRKVLPSAVNVLQDAHRSGERVYVHCTAGLGRAPGVVIAYLFWYHEMDLHEAYDYLTSIRPCGPKKEAVRGATYDLVRGLPREGLDHLPSDAFTGLSDDERQHLMTIVPRC